MEGKKRRIKQFCTDKKPKVSNKKCYDESCNTSMVWKTTAWGQCSPSCGTDRTKTRKVVCYNKLLGRNEPDEKCGLPLKPENVTDCMNEECPPRWHTGEWEQCSTSCGQGKKHRSVECHRGNQVVAERDCITKFVVMPKRYEPCSVECPTECVVDQSVFCTVMYLKEYCRQAEFRKLCCNTCKVYSDSSSKETNAYEVQRRQDSYDEYAEYGDGSRTGVSDYTDAEIPVTSSQRKSRSRVRSHTSHRYRRSVLSDSSVWTLQKLKQLGRRKWLEQTQSVRQS